MTEAHTRPIELGQRRRVLQTLGLIIAALTFAGLAVEVLRLVVFAETGIQRGGTVLGWFDLNNEDSIPTWFQGIQLALTGLVALAYARFDPPRLRWGWLVLGAAFFAMSLDELVSMHEQLADPLREMLEIDSGPLFYAWVIPAFALVLTFGVIMLPFLKRLPSKTALRLVFAGLIFLSGAVGLEMAEGWIHSTVGSGVNLPYAFAMVAEESLEMVGTLLALRALFLHFRPDEDASLESASTPSTVSGQRSRKHQGETV